LSKEEEGAYLRLGEKRKSAVEGRSCSAQLSQEFFKGKRERGRHLDLWTCGKKRKKKKSSSWRKEGFCVRILGEKKSRGGGVAAR